MPVFWVRLMCSVISGRAVGQAGTHRLGYRVEFVAERLQHMRGHVDAREGVDFSAPVASLERGLGLLWAMRRRDTNSFFSSPKDRLHESVLTVLRQHLC